MRSGQTVGDIFHQQGVSASDLQKLTDNRANANALRNIRPGQEFAFARGSSGALKALRFDRDEQTRVTETVVDGGFRETVQARGVERRTHVAHGVIEHSLFEAGNQAGLNDVMVLKLATAFGYDIDFAQDLRQGDSFTVIYDDVYCEGERMHDGDIIAATFINHGKRFSAFRYTDATGSHDVLQRRRPSAAQGIPAHAGGVHAHLVDLLASDACIRSSARCARIAASITRRRSGTPIHAAGEGKVAFKGWQGGYGNVVILQHGGHYSTLYGHMSQFAALKVAAST